MPSLLSRASLVVLGCVAFFRAADGRNNTTLRKYREYSEHTAVIGSDISIPCNVTASLPDDKVTLILWYRGDSGNPIYSVDTRQVQGSSPKKVAHKQLESRATFNMSQSIATLHIKPVRENDGGEYRCRVDFRRSRTMNSVMKVIIVVPPKTLTIRDSKNNTVSGVIGPYEEGATVSLICEASGGRPTPVLSWWKGSTLLDDSYTTLGRGFVRNELVLLDLQREDLLTSLTCQASNTNLTVPVSSMVTIDLSLSPQEVRIVTPRRGVSSGDELEVVCQTFGSRPPARLSWWIGQESLTASAKEMISGDGNSTTSRLLFRPTNEEHGKPLICKAHNPETPDSALEDVWELNIFFPPQLSLALGASQQYEHIREGSDVYFDCNIQANPWVHDVAWRFEDRPFHGNLSMGVIVSNQSLVLQRVRKQHRGRYQCVAANSEGEGRSEEVRLDVQFAPVCKSQPSSVFGVAKSEVLNITCEMESDPKEVTFQWTMNNTVENIEVKNFVTDGITSTVYYTPGNMLGYGSLVCWAKNSIGRTTDPCVYKVVPVGPPETMRSCVVTNHTMDSLLVQCEPGYDGGLPQTFHLEVHSSNNEFLKGNITAQDSPTFLVQDLVTGTSFILVLYASNGKGRSNSVALVASTLMPAERHTAEEDEPVLSPLLGILIGTVSALFILFIVIAVIVRLRTRRRRKDPEEIKPEKCEIPIQSYKEESIDSTIESPDVIPSDSQMYAPESKSLHLECTRRMNEEMYKILKQKQDKYEALVPITEQGHSEMVDDLSYGGYQKHTIHMDPPTEYADMLRGCAQVMPLPISDALDRRAPELPLINNMQQQSTRDCIRGDRIVATTPL